MHDILQRFSGCLSKCLSTICKVYFFKLSTNLGISKTRNGTERNERNERNELNERNAREKFTHRLVTANVCVSTMCSTHTVPYMLQKSLMGSQESCL